MILIYFASAKRFFTLSFDQNLADTSNEIFNLRKLKVDKVEHQ